MKTRNREITSKYEPGEREARMLDEAKRALKLKSQGLGTAQIASRLGCSQDKARQLLLREEGRL